jgi:hypothetical protein
MSIHDEQDLRVRLGAALDDIAPRPVPLDAVVTRGRSVLIRRRVTAAAVGLAVLAAAALMPALVHALHRAPPVTPHYHVTVAKPGPGSPPGLVASGLVNHARWQQRYLLGHGTQVCVSAAPRSEGCTGGPPPRGQGGSPASLIGDPGGFARLPGGRWVKIQMLYGYVRQDVDRLRVELSNGQVLALHPVAVFGRRYASYVALAVPFAAAVTQVTAYSANGEVAHTVPFTGGGSIEIIRWLAPDQPAVPRPASGSAGSGTIGGRPYAVRGWVGPWGSCFTSRTLPMDVCSDHAGALRPGTVVRGLVSSHETPLSLTVLQAASWVSYLIVTRSHGSALRLRPEIIGGQKYIVLPGLDHDNDVSWTAYDTAGRILGSGAVAALLRF